MRNYLLCVLLLATSTINVIAQPKIEKSEVFREPLSEGWTRLMLLENGNTLYLHYGGKKGIEVIAFGKDKKKIGTQVIKGEGWEARRKRRVEICGLYQINHEPVIFLQYFQKETPTLYRIRLNAADGRLKKEEKIGACGKSARLLRQMGDYNTGQDIHVEYDAKSGSYAVVFVNNGKDLNKRFKVLVFDSTHKQIQAADYSKPVAEFKNLDYVTSAIDGRKGFYIVAYGNKNYRGKEGNVVVSRLEPGSTAFTHKVLDFTEGFRASTGDLEFDHANNRLMLLTNTEAEVKNTSTIFVSFMCFIGIDDMALLGVKNISTEKVNEYLSGTLKVKESFRGMPQKLVFNSDNTLTILQESITETKIINSRSGSVVAVYSALGNIGITDVSSEGMELKGYAVMKKQWYGGALDGFYIADRDKGIWVNDPFARRYVNDNAFMSFEYLKTNSGEYVLFNDNPKNDDAEEGKMKRKIADNTDVINTICYTLKDGKVTRSYLFGEPEGKNNTRACYIEASHYDKATGTYTTVVSEQHGRKYESRIAWIHFD